MPAPKKFAPNFAQKPLKKPLKKIAATPVAPIAAPQKKSNQPERQAAFHFLRQMLTEFAPLFQVTEDTPVRYSLHSRGMVWRGGPLFFGEVRVGKVYTSLHLMPLYVDTALQQVSPELAKRKQGKTCFNFKKQPTAGMLDELRAICVRGIEVYGEKFPGWQGEPA